MTRRCSVRAQARAIYRELAAQKAADPPSHSFGGAGPLSQCYGGASPSPQEGGGEQDLTARVRALYEESAVPVREIAAIAGVTERTIYKYAARQSWQKRYARADFAPVKGAGARFIRREDKDKPVSQGIKAVDPAGAARAATGCGEAQLVSDEAQRQAEAAQARAQQARRFEARIRAMEANNLALSEYRRWRERRAKERAREYAKACAKWRAQGEAKPSLPKPSPHDLVIEDLYMKMVTVALKCWEALAKEEAITAAPQSENPAPVRARQR